MISQPEIGSSYATIPTGSWVVILPFLWRYQRSINCAWRTHGQLRVLAGAVSVASAAWPCSMADPKVEIDWEATSTRRRTITLVLRFNLRTKLTLTSSLLSYRPVRRSPTLGSATTMWFGKTMLRATSTGTCPCLSKHFDTFNLT